MGKKHNLKYDDIKGIVEKLVKVKSRNFRFDYFESEDIGQEIRIICMKALDKFDPSLEEKDKWINYFGRCVDNGLMNLKRDRYVRVAFDGKKQYESLKEDDTSERALELREKHKAHQKKIQKKLAIKHPIPIDGLADMIHNKKLDCELAYKDLERYILEVAPLELIDALTLMLNGKIKEVDRKERRKVRKFVHKIFSKEQNDS